MEISTQDPTLNNSYLSCWQAYIRALIFTAHHAVVERIQFEDACLDTFKMHA